MHVSMENRVSFTIKPLQNENNYCIKQSAYQQNKIILGKCIITYIVYRRDSSVHIATMTTD